MIISLGDGRAEQWSWCLSKRLKPDRHDGLAVAIGYKEQPRRLNTRYPWTALQEGLLQDPDQSCGACPWQSHPRDHPGSTASGLNQRQQGRRGDSQATREQILLQRGSDHAADALVPPFKRALLADRLFRGVASGIRSRDLPQLRMHARRGKRLETRMA